MELRDAIMKRRSIRAFKADAVPRSVLEQMMTVALRAPSWGNTQPWEFIVVTDEAKRKRLAELMTYGKFLADRILGLDPGRITPAHSRTDGVDFVPAHRAVLFGHHFASITGLAPSLDTECLR